MRLRYLFVLILLTIQGLLLFVEYQEAESVKQISEIFERSEITFTKKGEANFRQSLLCMSHKTKSFFAKNYNGNIDEASYISILETIIKSYPIQVQHTTTKDKEVSVDLFFNFPKPLVIQITAVQVDGIYKIDSIGHLCELFSCVNHYFEHKTI